MKFVTDTLNRYRELLGDYEEDKYNMELIEILNLDQRKAMKYLETTRIELDHVIDEASPERFFEYVAGMMEDIFFERDYNYAIEPAYVSEMRPPVVKEFIARMNKLFLEIPALQPKLKEIIDKFRNDIHDLEEIDYLRQEMLINKLIEIEEADPKVKRLLHKLVRVVKDLSLPELTGEEE
jgi:hypothetical protein